MVVTAPAGLAGAPPTGMAMGVEGTARLARPRSGAALLLDRCSRTISTVVAVLGAKPRLGVKLAWIVFGPSGRMEVLRLALPWRRATVPRSAAPSRKVMEPPGVPPAWVRS